MGLHNVNSHTFEILFKGSCRKTLVADALIL